MTAIHLVNRPEGGGASTFTSGSNGGATPTLFIGDPCFGGIAASFGNDVACVNGRYNRPDLRILGWGGYIQGGFGPFSLRSVVDRASMSPMHQGRSICR